MFDPFSLYQCDGHETEMDPGKDLFALLFMSFFLISVLMLLAIGGANGKVPVNTSGTPADSTVVLDEGLLARIKVEDGGISLCQGESCWPLPEGVENIKREARLFSQGPGIESLIVEDPGDQVGAGTMLVAGKALNDAGIKVEFRTRMR